MTPLPVRFLALFTAASLLAQSPRLYNPRLDKQADDLRRLAESTANGQFFAAELDNLDQLAKPSIDRIFTSEKRLALARINATTTWGNMQDILKEIQDDLALTGDRLADWQKQSDALRGQLAKAREAMKTAAEKPPVPELAIDILSHASNSSEIFAAADKLLDTKRVAASKTDLRVAESLTGLAGEFTAVLQALNQTAAMPGATDAVRRMTVALLRADLDHLTALGRIETRRLAAMADVNTVLASTTGGLKNILGQFSADDTIESSLKTLRAAPPTADSRRRLRNTLFLLDNYASLCARAGTPNRLAETRIAIETRRNGIRRDAIIAQSYEAVLTSGAQRIAAYYKGGIRPEVLAQVAQALATAGLIPAVVSK